MEVSRLDLKGWKEFGHVRVEEKKGNSRQRAQYGPRHRGRESQGSQKSNALVPSFRTLQAGGERWTLQGGKDGLCRVRCGPGDPDSHRQTELGHGN